MRAIDTDVLVRLLAEDDQAQLMSAREFVASGVWVSHLVLAEAVWVFGGFNERSVAEIAKAIERLLRNAVLTIEDPDVAGAALERFRRSRGVGFTDCLILETARKAGHLPLGTFDRKLAMLEGAVRL